MQDAPAVQTEKKSRTLDDVLLAEVEACKRALPPAPGKPKTPMRVPLEDFVKKSFMLHRRLFQRWNGWRFQGEIFLTDDRVSAEIVAQEEWNSFTRQIQNLLRDKVIKPAEGEGVNLYSVTPSRTLYAHQILSQKNFATSYPAGVDAVAGQLHTELDPEKEHKIFIGRCASGANQYGPCLKEMYVPIRVGQRVSAAVMRCLTENEVSQPLLATWEKLFQRLGELAWGSQKTAVQTTLSVAPSSFIRLGTLGENSCYRHGGEGEYSKYWLAGDCPDSFVALFRRVPMSAPVVKIADKEDVQLPQWGTQGVGIPQRSPAPSPVCARAWGIAWPEHGAMVSNFYQLPREMLMPSLLKTVRQALDIGEDELQATMPKMDVDGYNPWNRLMHGYGCVYLNKDVHLLYGKGGDKELTEYLKHVVKHAGTYGFYSRKGFGPTFLQINNNVYRVAGQPDSEPNAAIWPYSDVNLKEMAEKAAERGIFLPPANNFGGANPGGAPEEIHVPFAVHNIPNINWANLQIAEDPNP